jgi:glycosyltransferase involved in cell wall biosynthesis
MPSFDLGFVGNLSYLPNIQAVEYLHKNIFQRDKGFKILVSGAQPSNRIKKLKEKNFVIRGWVDDIRKSYSEICIFVAPIFAGTGQQNKILEAMSLEIPCITTTAVNKAIGAKNGDNILIADTPNQFLEKINLIKSDPLRAKTLGRNGRKFVLNHFTWLNHVQLLKKSFNKAIYEHSRKKDSV